MIDEDKTAIIALCFGRYLPPCFLKRKKMIALGKSAAAIQIILGRDSGLPK